MSRTALIGIDLQNDFCPGGALAVAGGDEVMAPINALMDGVHAVILTQDWHPADHLSFADNHPGAEPYSQINLAYGPQTLWPAHCVQGSQGAAFHPVVDTDRADLIIRKGFRAGIDSYSAFFENDKATPTGLAGYLRDRGITRLILAGLAYDFCVAWSALDGQRLGFDCEVVETACRAIDLDGTAAKAREAMLAAGVRLA